MALALLSPRFMDEIVWLASDDDILLGLLLAWLASL
jgi:hypothetical protein